MANGEVFQTFRAHKARTFLYLGVMPFIISFGGIFSMIILLSWRWIDSNVIWIIAALVHIVLQQALGLFGNRLLFWKFARTSYQTLLRLFGLHLLAVPILPLTACLIYILSSTPNELHGYIPRLIILSGMFYTLALLVTFITIRRILVSDEG